MFICCHKVIGWLHISMTSLKLYTFAQFTGQFLRPKINYHLSVGYSQTWIHLHKSHQKLQYSASKVKFLYQKLCEFSFFHCTAWFQKYIFLLLAKSSQIAVFIDRGVSGGRAVWAIGHPVFGRIEGAAGQRQWRAILLLAHPVLSSHLRLW